MGHAPGSTELDVDSLIGTDLTPEFTDPAEAKRLRIVEFNEDSATLREFEVAEEDGLWTIPSKNGYPADAERQMAEAATSLMDRKILAVASESAADHEQFGVIDPLSPKLEAGQKGVGARVTISDINDKPLVDLIIGREVKDATNNQHFVRKAGQDVVYVVEVDPTRLSTDFEDWIEKDLLKLNAFDIQDVQINDYSAELVPVMTNQGPRIQVAWDPRSELKLAYDDKDSKWTAEELKQFDKGTESYTEFKLSDDQELNAEKLDALKTALDDLAIVDVDKQAGRPQRRSQGGRRLPRQRRSPLRPPLARLRHHPGPQRRRPGPDLQRRRSHRHDERRRRVRAPLRRPADGHQRAKTREHPADATAADKAKAGDKSVQRYLFAMARFNEDAVKKPVLEELPPLPEEMQPPPPPKRRDHRRRQPNRRRTSDNGTNRRRRGRRRNQRSRSSQRRARFSERRTQPAQRNPRTPKPANRRRPPNPSTPPNTNASSPSASASKPKTSASSTSTTRCWKKAASK